MIMKNIFQNIPESAEKEIFEVLAKSENAKIERIISNGPESSSDEWYDQNENEWVVLLKGKAKLIFENDEKVLEPGDHILIKPHRRHKVVILEEKETTIWIAVHFI